MARSDGEGVVQFLIGKPWPDQALQLIGDALQVALRQEVREAPGLAGECIAALRVRGWEGDEELADPLEAGLGTAPSRLRRPLGRLLVTSPSTAPPRRGRERRTAANARVLP